MMSEYTRSTIVNAILDCFNAIQRGVSEPTIVQEDDGTFEYIPGAWLTDAGYTGCRNAVATIDEGSFGSEFSLDDAGEEDRQAAAEWAADEWEWETFDNHEWIYPHGE